MNRLLIMTGIACYMLASLTLATVAVMLLLIAVMALTEGTMALSLVMIIAGACTGCTANDFMNEVWALIKELQ